MIILSSVLDQDPQFNEAFSIFQEQVAHTFTNLFVFLFHLADNSLYIHFHHDLSTPAMSTDMSQVVVALFPSF